MRIASFDIFDTLITRLVAMPSEIFLLVANDLRAKKLITIGSAEFVALRINAETQARHAKPHRETTLDQIYAMLQRKLEWSDAQTAAARQIELDTEKQNLRVSPLASARIKAARPESDRILFISDMYLPGEFLKGLLREGGIWRDGDEIFVSGEIECAKASGEMFAHIREKAGDIASWRHLGDNEHADVKMPGRHGITGEHFSHCCLTRYENAFRPCDAENIAIWRSRVAAALRLSRLHFPGGNDHATGVWNIGVSVAGPLLFGFVKWTLEEAISRGVQRLYFISRDGQILLKIANQMIARWKLPIDARYLYGSRRAWRPAAAEDLDSWFENYVSAIPTPSDLRSYFTRLGVNPEQHEPTLQSGGFPRRRWGEVLSFEDRRRLWELIQRSDIGQAAVAHRKRSRALAQMYLLQEGFGDGVSVAIVDVGWTGSMQRSLDLIVAEGAAQPRQPLLGFYFGLVMRPAGYSEDQMAAYWRDEPGLKTLAQTNFAFLERFTIATHGSVRGYMEQEGRVVPELEPTPQSLMDWGAELFQASILKITEILLENVAREDIDTHEFFSLSRANFDLFVESPTLEEAQVFGKIPFRDQENDVTASTMVPPLSEWEIFRALLDYRRRLPGWWQEGTAKVTGSPSLAVFLAGRRLKQRLRR